MELPYKQNPIVEYRFTLKNMAVDLRDGLILLKLVEIISGGKLNSYRIMSLLLKYNSYTKLLHPYLF